MHKGTKTGREVPPAAILVVSHPFVWGAQGLLGCSRAGHTPELSCSFHLFLLQSFTPKPHSHEEASPRAESLVLFLGCPAYRSAQF